MNKRQILMLVGALIIINALIGGLPGMWNTAIYIILGLIVIVISYRMSAPVTEEKKSEKPTPIPHAAFSDSTDQPATHA